jgi:L-lactate dehydrogenase complex protein LldG
MEKTFTDWKSHLPEERFGVKFFPEFEARAKEVSSEVFHVKTAGEAAGIVSNLIKTEHIGKAVIVDCFLQQAGGIRNILISQGVEVYSKAVDVRFHAETADIGISGAEFGVAETGSIFMDSFSVESRLVSSLPPVHIVFIRSGDIVSDIDDALAIITASFNRGYISFITGPSRTADIERVLAIGVHGPSRLMIIAVDEESDGRGAL